MSSLPEGHADSGDLWYEEDAPTVSRRRGRFRWPVLIGVVVTAAMVSWLWPGGQGRAGYITGPGQLRMLQPADRPAAPQLRGELLNGDRFDSAAWAGEVIVVNFWGSWCPPCRVETPELVRSANAWRSSGVRFLGVDVRDERSAARAFARQYELPYPSLFDDDGTVTLSFRNVPPNAVPATFVFDRKGRIAATAFGRVTADGLAAVLRPLVREPG